MLTVWRPHAAENEGVGKADLTDLALKALGRGTGNGTVRVNPATSQKLAAGSNGRGHRP